MEQKNYMKCFVTTKYTVYTNNTEYNFVIQNKKITR